MDGRYYLPPHRFSHKSNLHRTSLVRVWAQKYMRPGLTCLVEKTTLRSVCGARPTAQLEAIKCASVRTNEQAYRRGNCQGS